MKLCTSRRKLSQQCWLDDGIGSCQAIFHEPIM